MKRREFITLLGGVAAWPIAARAQQPTMPVVGFLSTDSPNRTNDIVRGFRQGLQDTGYFEDRNVAIEYQWADGQYDRLPALAADLVRRQVTVIATNGGAQAALAAKMATTTIPIVFGMGADPVPLGLVTSLNRPGGNITGISLLNQELGPKRLQLLHEMAPAATIVGLLVNPTGPDTVTQSQELQAAAPALGLELHILPASTERDFDAVFATLVRLRAGALMIGADPFLSSRSEQLAALALRNGVPASHLFRAFVAAGGLMSYGGSLADSYRLVGSYTGRILRGERPADLPVQQSTKVELIINLRTAKALGLTVPLALLTRADEVIE
jgi:putative ABC transport system substrate-binding protein